MFQYSPKHIRFNFPLPESAGRKVAFVLVILLKGENTNTQEDACIITHLLYFYSCLMKDSGTSSNLIY